MRAREGEGERERGREGERVNAKTVPKNHFPSERKQQAKILA